MINSLMPLLIIIFYIKINKLKKSQIKQFIARKWLKILQKMNQLLNFTAFLNKRINYFKYRYFFRI
jgi:hypothetical protein